MRNLITGAVIAALIISAAMNWMQYSGKLAAPEQFLITGVESTNCNNAADPIGCVYERETAGR